MSRGFVSLLRIILGPRGRYVLCWLAALVVTGAHYYIARHVFGGWHTEATRRADGNLGHTLIDFEEDRRVMAIKGLRGGCADDELARGCGDAGLRG